MRARVWPILAIIAILATVVVIIVVAWQPAQPPAAPTVSPSIPFTQTAPGSTSTPTTIPTPPPTPAPLVYTVQEGDTLTSIALAYGVTVDELVAANGIADPNVLSVGQTLVIPGHYAPTPVPPSPPPVSPSPPPVSPTAEPSPVPRTTHLPTLTPSGPPVIEISQTSGAGDLAAEVVIVHNRGGLANLEGWQLSDAEGNTFTFPALVLFDDAEVRIHTKAGVGTPTDLYWNQSTPIWSVGELVTLRDAGGNVVDTYIVP